MFMPTILINLIVSVSATVMVLFIFYYLFVKPLLKKKLLIYWDMLRKENESKSAPFDNKKQVRFRRISMDTAQSCEPGRERTDTSNPLNFRFDDSLSSNEKSDAPRQQPSDREFEAIKPPHDKMDAFKQQPSYQEFETIKPPHDKLDAFKHIYDFMNSALRAIREIIKFIESDSPYNYNDKRGFINKLELSIENIFKYQISNNIYFNQQIDEKIKDILYSLKTIRQHVVLCEKEDLRNASQEIITNWGNLECDINKDLQLLKKFFEEDLKNSSNESKGQ